MVVVCNASVEVKPLGKVTGLPHSIPFVKSDKVRLFMEEDELKIIKTNWGKVVADPKAGNGEAALLFNTHFEWCLRVNPDYSKLTPGVQYAIRYRIRVDAKPGKKGQAFWAGLYSTTNKKSIGSYAPNVTDIDGEYRPSPVDPQGPPADHHGVDLVRLCGQEDPLGQGLDDHLRIVAEFDFSLVHLMPPVRLLYAAVQYSVFSPKTLYPCFAPKVKGITEG